MWDLARLKKLTASRPYMVKEEMEKTNSRDKREKQERWSLEQKCLLTLVHLSIQLWPVT